MPAPRAIPVPLAATILVAAISISASGPSSAAASGVDSAPASASGRSMQLVPGDDFDSFCLRRAVGLWRTGDVLAAVEALQLRPEARSTGDAERADFLLAWGLRFLGDPGTRRVVLQAAARTRGENAMDRLAAIDALERATDPLGSAPELEALDAFDFGGLAPEGNRPRPGVSDPGTSAPATASGASKRDAEALLANPFDAPLLALLEIDSLLRRGKTPEAHARIDALRRDAPVLADAVAARALGIEGGDPVEVLRRLAKRKARTDLERALVDAARTRVAGHATPGAGPKTGSSEGGTEDGRTPSRLASRERGFHAMREERWGDARQSLLALESHWVEDGRLLDALAALGDEDVAYLWRIWNARAEEPGALVVDLGPVDESLARAAHEALDLHREPTATVDLAAAIRTSEARPEIPPSLGSPDAESRTRVDDLERRLASARRLLRHDRRTLDAARRMMAREAAHFGRGLAAAAHAGSSIDGARGRLDGLLDETEAVLAGLGFVRDEEVRRIAERTARFVITARRNLAFLEAARHFHLDGPAGPRLDRAPDGIPTPREILQAEEDLVGQLESWFAAFADLAPELVRRSHDQRWVPGTAGRREALATVAAGEVARARRLQFRLEVARSGASDENLVAEFASRVTAGEFAVEVLEAEDRQLRREIASHELASARERHRAAGEPVAWALAVATHELAERDGQSSGESPGALREEATTRYLAFLEQHPDSPARSEVRFRLADALLQEARREFQHEMARFMDSSSEAEAIDQAALAPFVDYSPALAQYRAILDDDPAYPHRDLALFHAGMILSDEGNPAASGILRELVTKHPDSRHAQEAHLRLGDELFLARDFGGSLPHFESAAAGPDPEHAAIALYKAGWAYFNRDRFDEAAQSFRKLLALYESNGEAARATDLRAEAEDYLVHSLARAGGVDAFHRLFSGDASDAEAARTLASLGHLLRRFSQFDEAAATDSLWLARFPEAPEALDAAKRLVTTHERSGDGAAAREARLAHAPRFFEGSVWWRANDDPALREAASEFARGAYRNVALHHHHAARDADRPADWARALELYDETIVRWPDAAGTDTLHYYAGEVAGKLGRHESAVAHFDAAAAAPGSLALDAAWQAISARDAWYEASRASRAPRLAGTRNAGTAGAGASASPALGADSLATSVTAAIDRMLLAQPGDPRAADLRWRKANLTHAHRRPEAERAFAEFAAAHPADDRALPAARIRAQILWDRESFRESGDAYAAAARLARLGGSDSLAAELDAVVPRAFFRDAEVASVGSSPRQRADAGRRFVDVAERFPGFEHADQALYRAGLAFQEAGEAREAIAAWTSLVTRHPGSDLARDARLEVASAWEKEKDPQAAARALEEFAAAYPADPDASAGLLRAIDLLDDAKNLAAAEGLRTRYLELFPDDEDAALEFLEERARRELAALGDDEPVSHLLGPGTSSNLARYLALSRKHPDKASTPVLSHVQFLEGEEARREYVSSPLTQPLGPSVAKKKSLLEDTLRHYRDAAEYGIAPWNRASAFRIGEALVTFGDALLDSESPAGLSEDDLLAYEEVLEEQSFDFYDKGEEAWRELLRQGDDEDDPWLQRTRRELWPRLATRFVHVAELDYPLIVPEPGVVR